MRPMRRLRGSPSLNDWERDESMSKPPKHDPLWAKAKTVCRLNMEDIRLAKELGLSPKTLMKDNPSPTQRWKLPVKLWIRELHAKRFGVKSVPPPCPHPPTAPVELFDGDVPF